MRLMIDANIILDVLQKREPHCQNSTLIWKLCETEQDIGFVSTLAFADLIYIMRKELNAEQITKVLEGLKMIFQFEDFTASDMEKAAGLQWKDYEDAVQAVTAERVKADYIITRNVKDFANSRIPAFTPSEYLLCR